MSAAADVRYWQALTFRDAAAMMTWLTAVGFTEHAVYRNESDQSVVEHAEWLWPGGGGIMFGSVREGAAGSSEPGRAAAYLVTDTPDAVFEAALAAGGAVDQPMEDKGYGGRGGSVRDPEGNVWSFGDYQPR